jgi:ribosomal protein L34E
MPYVHCPRCGLRTYSAARWSHVDRCADCDEVLARLPAKRLTAPFDELEVEDRVRERLYGGPRSGNVDAIRRG